ncbi:hypothetical protein HAX54_052399 [Datura stramonium]|uniref:Uncharacterized protein n=1 Tax=Datura stramonium TaxID=4076 RepID=A0ABS8SZV6_DATST|nr:hypothetical protein [Datura stramonium]
MNLLSIAGDATRTNDDHHSCGGGYTPLDAGGAGDTGGVGDAGGAGGRYTLAAEEVRRQEDTPYRLGRSSVVGTSKVPSCSCECLKCNENMNMLLSNIESLTEAQGVTEAVINKLISKREITYIGHEQQWKRGIRIAPNGAQEQTGHYEQHSVATAIRIGQETDHDGPTRPKSDRVAESADHDGSNITRTGKQIPQK